MQKANFKFYVKLNQNTSSSNFKKNVRKQKNSQLHFCKYVTFCTKKFCKRIEKTTGIACNFCFCFINYPHWNLDNSAKNTQTIQS